MNDIEKIFENTQIHKPAPQLRTQILAKAKTNWRENDKNYDTLAAVVKYVFSTVSCVLFVLSLVVFTSPEKTTDNRSQDCKMLAMLSEVGLSKQEANKFLIKASIRRIKPINGYYNQIKNGEI